MLRALAKLLAAVALLLAALSAVFVGGMRKKSPPVLNAVRKTSRAMKPLALRSAGKPGAYASVIRHVGRQSGRQYETPIGTVPTDEGFVIALPYGPNTDWLKNVLASGAATIVADGKTYSVDQPEVVPTDDAAPLFPSEELRTLRLFGVDQCLRVRRTEQNDQATAAAPLADHT
jgi:deazaflavin-dependent oxidoreductase (nitroreductase family)